MPVSTSTTLPLYWDLASLHSETRLEAAEKLLSTLKQFQQQHPQSVQDLEKYAKDAALIQPLCAEDVHYALKRLIRGLPSSRDGARQGFALALTEVCLFKKFTCQLLSQLDFLYPKTILDLIDEYHQITGNMKPREERDIYYGILFGYLSIVRSTMLSRPQTQTEDIERMMINLKRMADYKPYMREPVFHVLIELCQQGPVTHELLIKHVLPQGISHAEELWLALHQGLNLNELSTRFQTNEILNPQNKNVLSQLLLDTTLNHPRVHSVWSFLLNHVDNVTALWTQCVESVLFDSSLERKFLGFQLFPMFLAKTKASDVKLLFTQKFMRTWMNHLSTASNVLHKAAKKLFATVCEMAQKDKVLACQLTLELLTHCSPTLIEKLKKQFGAVMTTLDEEGLTAYIEELKQSVHRQSGVLQQKSLLEHACALLRNPSLPRQESHIHAILGMLVDCAFQETAVREFAQEKLMVALSDLLKLKLDEKSMAGCTKKGITWTAVTLNCLPDTVKSSFQDVQQTSLGLLKSLSEEVKQNTFGQLVETVLLLSLFDASLLDVLQDINACFEDLFSLKRKHELNPMDVLLDCLLNMLSRPVSLLRHVVERVFQVFCDGLTVRGVELIFEALNSAEVDMMMGSEEDDISMGDSSDLESEGDIPKQVPQNKSAQLHLNKEEKPAPQSSSDESEQSDLDDEEMLALDGKLVELFKQQKELKKQKKSTKEQMNHFKSRVVTLLDIFLKTQPQHPLVFDIMVPSIEFAMKSSELQAKMTSVLIYKLRNVPSEQDVDKLLGILHELLQLCIKGMPKLLLQRTVSMVQFTVKGLLTAVPAMHKKKKKKNTKAAETFKDKMIQEFKELVSAMVEKKKAPIHSELLADLCQLSPDMGIQVVQTLASNISFETMKPFKIYSALQCVSECLKWTLKDQLTASFATVSQLKSLLASLENDTSRAKDMVKVFGVMFKRFKNTSVYNDLVTEEWRNVFKKYGIHFEV